MKKCIFQATSIGFLSLALGFQALAQTAVSPAPPPPPPAAKAMTAPEKSEQQEIIIKQKGEKDTKITLEIKNGELFINGKPSDKFDDSDIIIEKRDLDDIDAQVMPELSYSPSPFREHEWENAARAYQKVELDKVRSDQDMQRKIQKSIQIRMNEAFLGVSSRKTEKAGAAVLEVTPGSPAEKAGIKKGDLITKVNETKIDGPESLFETIRGFKPGDKVNIVLIREGKQQTVTATLEKSEQMMPKDFNYDYHYNFKMPPMPDMSDMGGMRVFWERAPKLGIKAQDAEDGKGVNILEVEDSSAAAKAGLKKGDVILQFDGKTVNSTNELIDQLQEARQKPQVTVKIQRGAVTREIQLKIPRKLKTAEL
jgi:serine protease Do